LDLLAGQANFANGAVLDVNGLYALAINILGFMHGKSFLQTPGGE